MSSIADQARFRAEHRKGFWVVLDSATGEVLANFEKGSDAVKCANAAERACLILIEELSDWLDGKTDQVILSTTDDADMADRGEWDTPDDGTPVPEGEMPF